MQAKFFNGINKDAKLIREEVFIQEQGFKNEFDEYDDYVDTLVLYNDQNEPIATARVYEIDSVNKIYKLGRIAVRKQFRGLGLGRVLIDNLEKKAKELGAKEFYVSAQVRAVPFYNKCGYKEYGKQYMDEHVPHIDMKKLV